LVALRARMFPVPDWPELFETRCIIVGEIVGASKCKAASPML
jgi:hypothetical protein